MYNRNILFLSFLIVLTSPAFAQKQKDINAGGRTAPRPLYRDPVYDGAADPVLVWNGHEKKWFMLYTNRRATAAGTRGVEWVHGTRIGIARSDDQGLTWKYLGTAGIPYGDSTYTHWAPEVIYHHRVYHMYLTIVPGIFPDWNAPRHIVHLTSTNLINWKYESVLQLASDKVIDACVIRLPDKTWRLWYKNERDRSRLYHADSRDLYQWTDKGVAIGGHPSEGPVVFRWKKKYWLICDVWDGLRVYASCDLVNWTAQEEKLLNQPGILPTDKAKGQHADVVVNGKRAFLFYFVHQQGEDAAKTDPEYGKRTVIHVAELKINNNVLVCDRNKPTELLLLPGYNKKGVR